MMIAAEKIVGPGRGLIQSPVSGGEVALFERFFLAIRFKTVVGPDVDAPPFPRKDFAPPIRGASALPVDEKFRTLGLRAQKGHLRKSAISAATAA
jgi:hypothetical protein